MTDEPQLAETQRQLLAMLEQLKESMDETQVTFVESLREHREVNEEMSRLLQQAEDAINGKQGAVGAFLTGLGAFRERRRAYWEARSDTEGITPPRGIDS